VSINLSSQKPSAKANARAVKAKYIDPYSAGVVPINRVIAIVTMTPKAIEITTKSNLLTSIPTSLQKVLIIAARA
jgi:hypothetical protein